MNRAQKRLQDQGTKKQKAMSAEHWRMFICKHFDGKEPKIDDSFTHNGKRLIVTSVKPFKAREALIIT